MFVKRFKNKVKPRFCEDSSLVGEYLLLQQTATIQDILLNKHSSGLLHEALRGILQFDLICSCSLLAATVCWSLATLSWTSLYVLCYEPPTNDIQRKYGDLYAINN